MFSLTYGVSSAVYYYYYLLFSLLLLIILFYFQFMATKKLNINTASVSDFENLHGIGRTKAEMIVKAREVSSFL